MTGSQALAFAQKIIEYILENISATVAVCIRKRATGDAVQAQVIPFPVLAPQADRYVPQTLQASGLRVKKHYELLPAAKTLGVPITRITINALLETITRNKLHNLAKYCIPSHWANPPFLIGFCFAQSKSNKKKA